MVVFIDTSAIYALLCPGDKKHTSATKIWQALLDEENTL
ncbi:MAG: hypothetical protein MAG431_00597 [Chloroflexi bacterium]|nr:hypothetical protein [Chloroflexota bacterium]